ncbi:uncharacterized protein LOC100369868 [Saccoglossus kowalevskii]|uniref:Cofilin-like n=1 Tax=Saccoglossus kowalevskii TaxID=10224 RepID=A0ABM0GQR0_SACKO|nr:PREDICTED: cofilin-like [Saccoglossus kowalevskii]
MASGVAVHDDVVEEFQKIKIGHKYKYLIFKIADSLKEIVVHHKESDKDCTYESFKSNLPADECRYAVYDMNYTLPDGGERNKLVFYVWCPDTAKIKQKMLYASSRDALRKKLVGVGCEVQATDDGELDFEDIKDKVSRGGVA